MKDSEKEISWKSSSVKKLITIWDIHLKKKDEKKRLFGSKKHWDVKKEILKWFKKYGSNQLISDITNKLWKNQFNTNYDKTSNLWRGEYAEHYLSLH